ncbi:response regulator transcription factor [Nocardioides bruguierae]|uniref:Response regulator transcription factor n=1 Tax=Nocardioides bruguierae TaxID=2945102 RepID=A0A9X2IDN9_9ACTN|nr:response regulator transcription factor [Nocardioides bruguierae]MCL8027253.1 response regulator transcription factor [Nocardioides bruguierae]MCM0619956.1 response regulator transcription factor [Nocardioides bruguierae]
MTSPAVPATSRKDFRVVIVEDHTLFAESLELALTIEGYTVRRFTPGPEATAGHVLAGIQRLRPRLVLLDLDLGPGGDGGRFVSGLAQSNTDVVVLTGESDRSRWGECHQQGARKVLPKSAPLEEILGVIKRAQRGLPLLDPGERESLVHAWQAGRAEHADTSRRLASLTPREQQVLAHLMTGATVRDVARADVVAEATVRTQVKSILAKLEVSSQLAAVGLAHRTGWKGPRA